MKRIRIFFILFAALLMLTACNTNQSESTESSTPTVTQRETTPVTIQTEPPETTPITVHTESSETESVPSETTSPVSTETLPLTTLPEDGVLSFYAFYNDLGMSFYEYYLAPAGTDEWYQVYLEEEVCYHPRPGIPFPTQGANVQRAYIIYDGPEVDRWLMRSEWYTSEECEFYFGKRDYVHLEYYNINPVQIIPDKTVICLGGWSMDPIENFPMEFCENCTEQWQIPVE